MNFIELFKKKSLIAAHRGASSVAPENTLLAMKKSVGECDFIEIDVQLSSDGVAIVMHDETLTRTTNVAKLDIYKGRHPYLVREFTLKELNTLDYGDGEPLLILREALLFIKENSLFLNVEIKDAKKYFAKEQIILTVLNEIQNLGVESQILISSFRGEYLKIIKELSPNLATAFLADDKHHNNLIEYLHDLDVDAYHINKNLLEQGLIDTLKAEGIFVSVYVVNDKKEQKRFFEMGVNAVFTNLMLSGSVQ